jgi:hypothetical protein
MNLAEQGKKVVNAVAVALVLINLISIISVVVYGQTEGGTMSVFQGLLRFAIIGSLLYFLYAGNKVAKWLLVIYALFNGLVGVFALLSVFNIVLLAIAITCIAIGIVLIVSKPVDSYMRFKRGELHEENNGSETESSEGTGN